MKTTLITLLAVFICSTTLYASELEWVDEQVEAIKPPRKGVNIMPLKDPFVFLEKNKPKDAKGNKMPSPARTVVASFKSSLTCKPKEDDKKSSDFVLSTIINSSAMIDGNWRKKGDQISSYTITDISKNSVTLKKGDKELILSTASKKPNLKFKNK